MALTIDGSDPSGDLGDLLDDKLNVAGGKVLQIVRATDATDRTTTSASFVDVTGMSVTITPTRNTSAVMVIASFFGQTQAAGVNLAGAVEITDASNNRIGGLSNDQFGLYGSQNSGTQFIGVFSNIIGYATPATLSATTYKLRFRAGSGTFQIRNDPQTGQMYAIEVSA
jgi:hypothetical protein